MASNQEVVFNRVVVPPLALAEFLLIDEGDELTLTEMQSLLYDRLYRLGAVRNVDGTRAYRKRRRDREAAKRRRKRAREARRERMAARR